MDRANVTRVLQFPSNITGNAAAGVQVTVSRADGGAFTMYATNSTSGPALSNPLATDSKGFVAFYARDGIYNLDFNDGFPRQTIQLTDVAAVSALANDLQDSYDTFSADILNQFDTFVDVQGLIYKDPDTFTTGSTLDGPNEALKRASDGEYFRRTQGPYPYTVTPGTDPTADPFYAAVGSASLAERLAAEDSDTPVGGIKASALSDGATATLRSLGWTPDKDATPFMALAAAQGIKKLLLPKGTIKMSALELTSAFQGMEFLGVSSGFAYAPQTNIEPFASGQTDLFVSQSGVGGVDNVKFRNLKLSGLDTTDYGIRQLSGAGWEYNFIQTEGFNEWDLWSVQGLNYYNRMFIRGSATGNGAALYSDFFADNFEISGGVSGLRVLAGGGRLSNILVNSQTDSCVELSPLDENTNHINTSITNLYVGEVFNAAEKPIIRIKGNATKRVTDVQITNVHTVSAAAVGVKHNWHMEIEKADRVTINGWAALGIGAFETADLYDAGGAKVTDCKDIVFASGTIHNLSRSPIVVINSEVKIGAALTVTDWGGAFATGNQKDAVYCNDTTSKVSICSGADFKNERVASTRVGYGATGLNWAVGQISLKLAGTGTEAALAFAASPASWSAISWPFGPTGVNTVEEFGRKVTYTGTFDSSGAGDYAIKTLANSAVDQSYIITIQQNGSGANATSGFVFANAGLLGAATSGNTNSAGALQNSFKVSGNIVQATIGSGYGPTTWRWQMTRML